MNIDIVLRIIFTGLFLATLVAGYFLFKNFDKLLGADPQVPTDNSGSRGLNKVQVVVIWLHAVLLTGAFAFWLF
jgi:hypothetical protein